MKTKKNKFAPWPYFSDSEISAVTKVLRSGRVNQWGGNEVCDFEKEFADYLGLKYAVALANGSVALELALASLGIGEGDEVIVPSRTFVATASSVSLRGATPVFADIDRNSQLITFDTIKNLCTPKTKAVIAVHLGGWPCELDKLRQFCDSKGIYLIEDCAQAHGAKYKGKPVGSWGHIGCFSFCQDKIITTGGEGGLLATNDKKIWEYAWSFKDHGRDYDIAAKNNNGCKFQWTVKRLGTNYRMTEMQAAIGRKMFSKLDKWVKKRKSLASILDEGFKKLPALRATVPDKDCFHSYYKYYVFVRPERLKKDWSRDKILKVLLGQGIPCGSGICPEVYLEEAFKGLSQERLPIAKELGETSMMFLVHPTLNKDNMNFILKEMTKVLATATN
ncbi:MAG: DegT/DnrJ/EryC1/StrS aminotransferase family protein [Candidatus Omnitrophota bacterium]|nr:MAG: DegT/DnrJ/EryC1/StrS aminotransferase family protein [Candidatus Omnitrophota bacterium]